MPSPCSDSFESTFSFRLSPQNTEEALIQLLKQFGFSRQQLVQTRDGVWEQIRVYSDSGAEARRFARWVQENKPPKVRFSQKRLTYRSWADKWKEDYKIQTLGRFFVVVPSWRRRQFQPQRFKSRIPIWIDPLSAFGSGEHETTRLVVRLMETLRGRFHSFLDVGTGTGILSIVAAHLNAQRVLGFDSDRPSVQCAEFNFQKNNLKNISVHFVCRELARFRPQMKFDLVGANINSSILEKYRHAIVRAAAKGGWVLASGILRQTYASFREAFDGPDLRCVKIVRGRRWVAVLYRKC